MNVEIKIDVDFHSKDDKLDHTTSYCKMLNLPFVPHQGMGISVDTLDLTVDTEPSWIDSAQLLLVTMIDDVSDELEAEHWWEENGWYH